MNGCGFFFEEFLFRFVKISRTCQNKASKKDGNSPVPVPHSCSCMGLYIQQFKQSLSVSNFYLYLASQFFHLKNSNFSTIREGNFVNC
jgi:hypothetical protein